MDQLNNFFLLGPAPENVLHYQYNIYLLLLSYFLVVLASYVAFDMSQHLLRKQSTSFSRLGWLLGSALIMGIGLWTCEYVRMLALIIPDAQPFDFDLFWSLLSLFIIIIFGFFAFTLATSLNPKKRHYLIAGCLFGIGIPIMKFVALFQIDEVKTLYIPGFFAAAVLVPVFLAPIAFSIVMQSPSNSFFGHVRSKLVGALLIGLAIFAMNKITKAGLIYLPGPHTIGNLTHDFLSFPAIAMSIVVIAFIVSIAKYIFDYSAKNKNDFLESVLNKMSGAVVACDPQGKITLLNRNATKIYGSKIKLRSSLSELVTKFPFFKEDSEEQLNAEETPFYRALKGEKINNLEVISSNHKGDKVTLLVGAEQLKGWEDENWGAVTVLQDITKTKLDAEELKYRATHDLLTGLSNRTLLLDRTNQAIERAKRDHLNVTVIFIDLDHFKIINDALGHSVGDSLLKMVATRLKALLRASDTLARIGGDEFVIIIPDQENINLVPNLLERILESIAKPYVIEKQEFNITCSMGFSVFPDNGTDAETLLKNADAAMYEAKEGGRNTFQFYTGEMNTQVKKRLEMENGLRHALLNDEFILEYQAKFDIQKNILVGFEALIRWNHPEKDLIPPSDFISIAEDTGLILPIGMWVLKTACAQNKAWQDAGIPPFCVSVNLSSRQCKERNLFQKIKTILEETGLQPQYLELELTESMAMGDPEEFIEMLNKFKELGVKISIDDFGTGYSSLNYLRQFPVNCLKIDQSFVSEIGKKIDDLSIIKAIVTLGHSLNMKVIAEGVETKEQLVKLQRNNCDEIQGFYLSRPIPPNDIADFIKNTASTFQVPSTQKVKNEKNRIQKPK